MRLNVLAKEHFKDIVASWPSEKRIQKWKAAYKTLKKHFQNVISAKNANADSAVGGAEVVTSDLEDAVAL